LHQIFADRITDTARKRTAPAVKASAADDEIVAASGNYTQLIPIKTAPPLCGAVLPLPAGGTPFISNGCRSVMLPRGKMCRR
jgi:hypothetical protein